VEEIEDGDLNVDQEPQFLRKGGQGAVMVGCCFEQIIDTDGGFGWFGVAESDAVVVEFEVIGSLDDFLVACEGD